VIEPRYAWAPPRVRSLGPDCVEFWKAAGGTLFDWQAFVIDGILGLNEDDRWSSTDDGLTVARQNGKGVILQAVEVFVAFELGHSLGYDVVMHTAHEFATSQEHQIRLEDFIQDCPHLHAKVKEKGGYVHANGQESIRLKDGTRIIFKARTKGGGRGYSGDLLAWDEAMVVPDAVVGAQKPMLRASRGKYGPKTIYAGSAVDQEVHEYGVNFARIRKRGIEKAPRVSYFEWSAPFDDPTEITEDLLRDRSNWPLGNPSMADGLVSEEYMADEIETMPSRTAAVELWDVGDWPETDPSAAHVLSLEVLKRLVDVDSVIDGRPRISFDVSPDRSMAAIGCAGRRSDGLAHVEVLEHKPGTRWVVPRLIELHNQHDPVAVICDGASPAASLIHELENVGIEVETLDSQKLARACGVIFDLVQDELFRHLGQAEFMAAVRGAAKRPLGETWAWSRKTSQADITPLVAVTNALFGFEIEMADPEPMVSVR
jgi:hypothetical protein